jgi:hypothetical protein
MQSTCKTAFVFLALATVLAGCAAQPEPKPAPEAQTKSSLPLPKPAVTEYVKTEGAGFTVQDGYHIRYAMTYLLKKEVGDAPSYMVEFENPEDGKLSLANGGMLDEFQTNIVVESPLLACIQNNRNYRVRLKLFSHNRLVARHDDLVQFSLPRSMMTKVKLPTCVYPRR